MSHEIVGKPDHFEHHFQYFGEFLYILCLDHLLYPKPVARQKVFIQQLIHDFENLILLMDSLRGFIVAADTAKSRASIDHDFDELLLGYLPILKVFGQQY